MARFALASRKASRRRAKAEADGESIPPFLIASITSSCNLHCAGCYSRQNHACTDAEPVNQLTAQESKDLAPGDVERGYLKERLSAIREEYPDMVFISFPGGEKSSGGCLAAERGFFHINSHGGAEPCPFSPYSDINVKDPSLRQALCPPFFTALRKQDVLMEEHSGGCVLFERRESVEAIVAETAAESASASNAG